MAANDIDRLTVALGVAPIAPPSPVGGGASDARLWRIELTHGPHLLRVYDRYDEPAALREAAVMKYLAGFDLPVARVAAQASTDDRSFLLVEWLDGQSVVEALMGGWAPRPLGEEFGRLQARLHRIEAPADLPPAWNWPSPEAYPARLLAALEQLAPSRNQLVHLDYHPSNVLARDGEMCGLIDWTNARSGDPRFDVARTYLILRTTPGLDARQKAASRARLRAFLHGWWRGYREICDDVWEMAPFLAWAGIGLQFDLDRKPADWLPPAALDELQRSLALLQRKLDGWMARL